MRLTYGLQGIDSLLEHIAFGFQSLKLIFVDFCITIVCACSKQWVLSAKC